MKSAHIVFVLFFTAGCVMNGCKQDNLPTQPSTPDPPSLPLGSGVLRASIDGLPWAAEGTDGLPSGSSKYSGSVLHINGVRAVGVDTAREPVNAETLELIINLGSSNGTLGPGTYELGAMPPQEGEAQYRDALSRVTSTDSSHLGTVTITALDVTKKVVSGTFAFNSTGVNGQTHLVSQGMFDVTWK
jgi:hypothetical protein